MKKFRFRLQAVLEQRERQEHAAKLSFAEAERALGCANALLVELREVREAILHELASEQETGVFDPMLNRLYQDYLQTISKGIQDQVGYVNELATTCEAFKLHLISSAQSKQTMVSARDRAKVAHQVHFLRAEQYALDEVSTARHNYHARAASE